MSSSIPMIRFETRSGWVVIGIANDSLWSRFLKATGLPLGDDPRYKTNPLRVENHEPLREELVKWAKQYTKDEIVNLLTDAGVPCCPIYDVKEASEGRAYCGCTKDGSGYDSTRELES